MMINTGVMVIISAAGSVEWVDATGGGPEGIRRPRIFLARLCKMRRVCALWWGVSPFPQACRPSPSGGAGNLGMYARIVALQYALATYSGRRILIFTVDGSDRRSG